uniref:Uncharacterized protein n=1 Tax=Avena sativa TaxID=4498 RepID=A0ACD6ADL5_AVESA
MANAHDELEKKLQDSDATPISLPLEFLKAITCDFSTASVLGEGGYGVVYKGVLRSGKIIAVKKLFEIRLKEETFQNEVRYLMGIKHQNVVQFLGYCAESSWEAIEQPSGSGKHIFAEKPKRLLCFEYVPNKSLDKHISDKSSVLQWNMRYEIIKGICSGLNFLHEECRIVHLDLKPENILMDAEMIPKIADFGLSRIFGNQQSRIITDNCVGSRGYMAPEYLIQGLISRKADIFSLGVIIIEIITGHRDYPYFQLDSPQSTATSCQHFVEKVLGSWRNKFESTSKYISSEKYNQQVKRCIEIALKCVDPGMEKRPTTMDIVQALSATDQMETSEELPSEMQSLVLHSTVTKDLKPKSIGNNMSNNETDGKVEDTNNSSLSESSTGGRNHQEEELGSSERQEAHDKTSRVILGPYVLLDVYPLELRFRFEPNKLIPCSLHLKNNTDENVAFGLMEKSSKNKSFTSLPVYGIVAPMSTYTLVVTTNKHEKLPDIRNVNLILQNTIVDPLFSFSGSATGNGMQPFQEAEKLGNTVDMVTLKAVWGPQGETTFAEIPPLIKVISVEHRYLTDGLTYSIYANQTEPLIITGHSSGEVHLWNYDTQKSMGSIKASKGIDCSVKFIPQKQWFMAVSHDCFVHVYKYEQEMRKITTFKANDGPKSKCSLAVHPTKPYVLAGCNRQIKLFDWDGWKCIRTFEEHWSCIRYIAFNPEDTNSFASASWDCKVKVWNLHSPQSMYTLSGHSDKVNYLDFFTRDGQQYLITGSNDKTAKIWDMQKKKCVRTLAHRSEVSHVISHPILPVLITGTTDGLVYLWSSTNFRLKRILNICHRSPVTGLACLTGSTRVAVAHSQELTVIEICDEEQSL